MVDVAAPKTLKLPATRHPEVSKSEVGLDALADGTRAATGWTRGNFDDCIPLRKRGNFCSSTSRTVHVAEISLVPSCTPIAHFRRIPRASKSSTRNMWIWQVGLPDAAMELHQCREDLSRCHDVVQGINPKQVADRLGSAIWAGSRSSN